MQTLSATTNPNSPLANVSGEDLFAGIFFLKGNIVNEIDVLLTFKSNIDNQDLQTLHSRAENVINEINSVNPDFFTQFQNKILQGDNQSVLTAIDGAVQLLTDLEIENGEGAELISESGKKKSKWIIINHFLIKRSKDYIENADPMFTVLLEKEQLVNSIVSSLN